MSSGFSIRFTCAMSSSSIVSPACLARQPAHASMMSLSSRSSGACSRRHTAPTSSGNVEGVGFSSPASNAAALSWLKSSGLTRCESSST